MSFAWLPILLATGVFAVVAEKMRSDMHARMRLGRPGTLSPRERSLDWLAGVPARLAIGLVAAGLLVAFAPLEEATVARLAVGFRLALVGAVAWVGHGAAALRAEIAPADSRLRKLHEAGVIPAAFGAVGGTLALAVAGVPVLPLAGLVLGAGAIAAVAARDALADLLAGARLMFGAPYAIGDHVRVRVESSGSDAARRAGLPHEACVVEGRIRETGWTRTILRAPDGRLVHVPNRILAGSVVANAGGPGESARAELLVPVASDTAPDRAHRILLTAAREAMTEAPERAGPGEPEVLFESLDGRASIARIVVPARDPESVAAMVHLLVAAVYRKSRAERVTLAPQPDRESPGTRPLV